MRAVIGIFGFVGVGAFFVGLATVALIAAAGLNVGAKLKRKLTHA